eukprot:CAMPEP_0206533118 /NCGR_PEP_ID=MMETSP0325_2-20121206/4775_1 /ASSEMBLY_ACC=CAM_ASM_000347 /TAXON_ID=2866 /ORGANISM="Crypthecodinium cohnii, Strain Seligo" /LENGTH=40 /DNA_ID= /DNA_START= /DNA_END= /DNA_ORIENTATION=
MPRPCSGAKRTEAAVYLPGPILDLRPNGETSDQDHAAKIA